MSQTIYEIGKFLDPSIEGLKPSEIIATLQSHAVKIDEGSYTKRLDQNELGIAKSKLADVSIQIARINDEKKEAMADFKEALKMPQEEHKTYLEMIKTKSVREDGLLYWIDDQERQLMYAFDKSAVCVDVRPMSIQERQLSINSGEGVRMLDGTNND